MRDLAVTLIVFSVLPLVLFRPWTGILLWSWLGYMNPHRLSWGFAFDFPFAQIAAVATLAGFIVQSDRRMFIWNGTTVLWLLLLAWMTLTTFFALDAKAGWEGWEAVMKIQLFAFLSIMLIRSRARILPLVWVIVLSLGFYGFKGGLFVFITGGEFRVWGPQGSFITDNNDLALALIMTLPLMYFLFEEAKGRWLRIFIGLLMFLTCASILGSHSRGAALAGAGMLLFLWWKSSHKLRLGMAMIAVLPFLVLSMPQKYFDRVETIRTFEEDGSAMARIRAWRFAIDMASQRTTGGGFQSFEAENYRRFSPAVAEYIDRTTGVYHNAHSVYFRMLGEHGFVGLFLFLILGLSAYWSAGRVIQRARDLPSLSWTGRLAAMLQVSMVGYAVGGAFLGLSYFDLYYALLALVMSLQITQREEGSVEVTAAEVNPQGSDEDTHVRHAVS